jgi:hypothetical protein
MMPLYEYMFEVPSKMNSRQKRKTARSLRSTFHHDASPTATAGPTMHSVKEVHAGSPDIYHRRPTMECCILPGETDGDGLDMEIPVAGLTMGIALRPRVAAGW